MKNNLPKAVKRQAERADELIAQAKNGDDGKTGDTVVEPNLATITGDKEANPKPDERQAPVKTNENMPDFKHKYEVLQAKYNAEVPALHQQVKLLDKQVSDLKELNERLEADIKALKVMSTSTVSAEQEDSSKVLDALDADDPEIAAMFRKQQADLAKALAKIDELEQGQSKIDERFTTAEERSLEGREAAFYAAVEKAVPNWSEVNVDQGFIDWLAVRVPGTVYTRQQLLDEAHAALDSDRVVELFMGYLSDKKSGPAGRSEEDLIDPASSGGSGGGEAEKPTYSRAWIKSFYADISKGKSRFSEDEQVRIDRDIQAAQADGRIRD